MRLNWIIDPSMSVSMNDIQNACKAFYDKNKVVPDTVKMTYKDYSNFMGQLYQQAIQVLDRDKKYGLFMMIPGGMVELLLLEEEDESVGNNLNGSTIMVVESTHVDREFERHVLNEGK